MLSHQIFFLLLPVELLPFKISHLLDFITLLLESHMSLIISFLQILNELLAFSTGMVVDLEGTLGPQEIRIGIIMIILTYLLPLEGQSYHIVDLIAILIEIITKSCGVVPHPVLRIIANNTIYCVVEFLQISFTF